MLNWFRQISVASRLRALALLSVMCLFGVTCALMWSSYQQQLGAREAAVRQAVEVAHASVQWVHARQMAGELNEAQAQKMALSALDKLRYGSDEYFWVNDLNLRMVHHPIKPQLDGQDVAEIKAPNGVFLFKHFVNMAKEHGQGFVNYPWPKPGMNQPQDKVSYVKRFEPWGWVLGSSLYIDDVQAAFQQQLIKALIGVALTAFALAVFIEITARDLAPRQAFQQLTRDVGSRYTTLSVHSQLAQQNTAQAEDTATAALKDQGDSLAVVVNRFRMAGAI